MTNYLQIRIRKLAGFIALFIILSLAFNNSTIAMADSTDIAINYNTQIPLLDESGKVVAYYYRLVGNGYIITDVTGSDFIEYSKDKNCTYLDQNKTYYYSGPLSIFEKSGTTDLVDFNSGEKVKKSSFKSELETADAQTISDLQKMTGNSTSRSKKSSCKNINILSKENFKRGVVQESVKHATQNALTNGTHTYEYNVDGTCGSTAASIFLMYYHDFVSKSYVPSEYLPTESSGEKFCKVLIPYIESDLKGSTYARLVNGINSYLKSCSVNANLTYTAPGLNDSRIYSTLQAKIDKNEPCILGVTGHPKYSEHWVVATGYTTTDDPMVTEATTTTNYPSGWSPYSEWGSDYISPTGRAWDTTMSRWDSSYYDTDSSYPSGSSGYSDYDYSYTDNDYSYSDDNYSYSDYDYSYSDYDYGPSSRRDNSYSYRYPTSSGRYGRYYHSSNQKRNSNNPKASNTTSNTKSASKKKSLFSSIIGSMFSSGSSDNEYTTTADTNNNSDNSMITSDSTKKGDDSLITGDNVKTSTNVAIVNDGWGNVDVYINLEYVDGLIFFP